MINKKLFVVSLLAIPLLSGCSCSYHPTSITEHHSFTAPEDWQIQKKDSIVTMEFVNVPTEPIEIGYFSQAGIGLKVRYTDNGEITYPFDESFFPLQMVGTLKTAGPKAYDITFKENHFALNFTLKNPSSPRSIKVTFIDHNKQELTHNYINYLDDAIYTGEDVDSYEEESGVNVWDGLFLGRTQKLYRDEVLTASYEYRPYASTMGDDANWRSSYVMPVASSGSEGTTYKAVFYFGRIHRHDESHNLLK